MWVSSSTKGARRHWIWLALLLSLQVVHGAEETPAENTTPQDTSTPTDSSTNQNSTTQDSSTTQNNSNNNSTNNDCDCDCDYFVRQVTCPFDHLDNPHYDKQNDFLLFIDQYLAKICMYDPNTGCTSSSCQLDEPLGSVIPLLDSCNEYIIGYGPKLAKMKWDGCCDTCPEITIISRHDKEKCGIVFNAGVADVLGHLLMNTKGPVGPDGETESGYATLYRYSKRECGLKDALGKDDREDYLNGIAFNCNYTAMYMCETKKKKIYKFDYDLKTGKPSNKKTVFDYDKANEDGRPNGLAMDCCGRLWVASQGAGKVLEVEPDTSKVRRTIKIPARDVIAVTFGGCGLDVMYVTTSQRNLTYDEKKEQPQAGSVFAVHNLCVQGLPANDACICRGGCFCSGFYDPCGCTSCGKDDKDDDDKDNNNDGNSQNENSNNGGSESNNNDSNNSGNNTTNSNSNSCRSCGYGGKYGFRTASSGDYERCRGCCEVCGGVGYRFGACYGGGSCGGGKSGGCNNGYGSCGCSKSGGCNNGYGSCGCSKSCGCYNGYGSCGCCKSCGSGNGYGSCGCCNSGGFNSYGLCDCGKSCGSSCGSSKGYSSCCCCKSYVTEKDSTTSTNNTSDGSSDGTNGSGSGCSCGNGVVGSCGGCGNGNCGSSGSCGGCGRSGCGSCGGNGGDGYGCGGCGRGGYTSCVGGGSCSCFGLYGPCGSCGGCGSCGSSGCGGRCGSCGGSSGCGGRCGSCGGSGCGGRCGSCGCGSSGNCCPSGSSGPPRGSCGCCSRGPYGSGRAGYVPGACGSCRGNGGCDNLIEGLLSVLATKKNY